MSKRWLCPGSRENKDVTPIKVYNLAGRLLNMHCGSHNTYCQHHIYNIRATSWGFQFNPFLNLSDLSFKFRHQPN